MPSYQIFLPKHDLNLIKNLKLEKLKISSTMNIEDNFVYNEYDEIKNNNNFKEDDLGIVLASVR